MKHYAALRLPIMGTPTAPPSGDVLVYAKSDGGIYKRHASGVETPIAGGGTVETPGISLWRSGALSLPSGTTTVVPMDSVRYAATGGMTTASGTVVVPAEGWYQVNGCLTFSASTSSARRIVMIGTGSGTGLLTAYVAANTVASAQDTAAFTTLQVSAAVYLDAGQSVGIAANPATAWGLDVSQSYMNNLSVTKF